MHRFANPARFNRLANAILPWSIGIMAIAFSYGLYQALVVSPPDYQQGETVRIMYLHVPSAWMSLAVYVVLATASFVSIVWRHPLADIAAKASAPVGAAFTALALFTGSLWGKPMWGTYWVWDARITSYLILLFLYLGYIALWQSIEDKQKAARAAGILAMVGIINLPIIKFSVDWWNTIHQPASVLRMDGPTIDSSMLIPLFTMFIAFHAYFITLLLWRMKAELNGRKLEVMKENEVQGQ